jgi:hypothetical protein
MPGVGDKGGRMLKNSPWRAGYEALKKDVTAAAPEQQFLFDRAGGLLEYIYSTAYETG